MRSGDDDVMDDDGGGGGGFSLGSDVVARD